MENVANKKNKAPGNQVKVCTYVGVAPAGNLGTQCYDFFNIKESAFFTQNTAKVYKIGS
jgi:hypothetical protein